MIKYTDLYDYVINVLYELKQKKQIGFFSLKNILDYLDYPYTPEEFIEIAKYLEAMGYIDADFKVGDVFIKLKPQGIIHIESRDKYFLSSFEEYKKSKKIKTLVADVVKKMLPTTIEASKNIVIEIVDDIIAYLKEYKQNLSLDLSKDANILKLEIQKEEPQIEVIGLKIAKISSVMQLKQKCQELASYFSYALPKY